MNRIGHFRASIRPKLRFLGLTAPLFLGLALAGADSQEKPLADKRPPVEAPEQPPAPPQKVDVEPVARDTQINSI
jgi:hypothetical protein